MYPKHAEFVDLPLRPTARGADLEIVAAVDQRSARLGQAVHRVLEWAASPAAAAQAAAGSFDAGHLAVVAAAEFGVADSGAVQAIATRILASADCGPLFDAASLAWAGNEVPVAGVGAQAGELLRIDRLVCTAADPPTWWVLDYKLDGMPQHDAAYRDQLAGYRRAVQAVQTGVRVRAAFITGAGELIELA